MFTALFGGEAEFIHKRLEDCVEINSRLFDGHAGFKPPNRLEPPTVSLRQFFRANDHHWDRQVYFNAGIQAVKPRRRNADNGHALSADLHDFADYVGTASEAPRPVVVADDAGKSIRPALARNRIIGGS